MKKTNMDVLAVGHSCMFCLFTQSRLLAVVPAEFATQGDDEHLESCGDTDSNTFHISSFFLLIFLLATHFLLLIFHSFQSGISFYVVIWFYMVDIWLFFGKVLFILLTFSWTTFISGCWKMLNQWKPPKYYLLIFFVFFFNFYVYIKPKIGKAK